MIWDLLSWLQLQNLQFQINPSQNASNFLILAYALTYSRSWLFAAAFLICEVLGYANFFGFGSWIPSHLYGSTYFLALTLVWAVTVNSHVNYIKNKALAFWCCIMIATLIGMAIDRAIYPYDKTYAYDHYESIVVLIHCCIILSIYKPKALVRNLVFELRSFGRVIFSAYSIQFICYNVRKFTQHNSIFKSGQRL